MLSVILSLAAAPVAQQMEPARQGKLQCQNPDALFKTCESLSRVVQVGPTSWRFDTEMLVDPEGPVIMTERSVTTVEGNTVCDVIRLPDIDHWGVRIGDRSATASETARFRNLFKSRLAKLAGMKVCTEILDAEEGIHKVVGTIGGVHFPAADYSMKWVDPGEGWTVGQ